MGRVISRIKEKCDSLEARLTFLSASFSLAGTSATISSGYIEQGEYGAATAYLLLASFCTRVGYLEAKNIIDYYKK